MNIHFIAIGGSAMHNLALALYQKGEIVTGSDDVIFEPSKSRLEAKGLLPEKEGWFPEKITSDLDAIILGMHAKADNPELLKAKELGLKVYSYPEYLYEASKNKTRVVIGGSHGKTTITSMILHVMNHYNVPVDFLVGAQLEGFTNMVHLTKENDFIVIEGDEYLSSPTDLRPKFHLYQPHIALISGIAWDHINVFPTFENYVEQFDQFCKIIEDKGVLVYNEEDPDVKEVATRQKDRLKTVPYTTPQYDVNEKGTVFHYKGQHYPLNIFGAHNLQNLYGALNVVEALGISPDDFLKAMKNFTGAGKRLEKVSETPERILYKDFAHSPS